MNKNILLIATLSLSIPSLILTGKEFKSEKKRISSKKSIHNRRSNPINLKLANQNQSYASAAKKALESNDEKVLAERNKSRREKVTSNEITEMQDRFLTFTTGKTEEERDSKVNKTITRPDLNLPIIASFAQRITGTKDSLLTIMQNLQSKDSNPQTIDTEQDAALVFSRSKDYYLNHNLTIPSLIIPEPLAKDAAEQEVKNYYDELQTQREETRKIKDNLYKKVNQLKGEPKKLQKQLADMYATKRKTLVTIITDHEARHGLPSTESWSNSFAKLELW